MRPERHTSKPARPEVLLHRYADGRFMSFFGDLHPSYFGNVVKAMGSAKQGFPVVSRVLAGRKPSSALDDAAFLARLNRDLRAVVHEVRRLTPAIIEVVLRAPVAARRFRPGQFYRMQNFEAFALHVPGTTLAMEGLALTGAWVDRDKGLISVIALEMGGSADLLAYLQPGEPVILMGPTGTPTEIPARRKRRARRWGPWQRGALLDRPGDPRRRLQGRLLRRLQAPRRPLPHRGHRGRLRRRRLVLRRGARLYSAPPAGPRLHRQHRPGHARLRLRRFGAQAIAFSATDRIIAIGSDQMMAAVAAARHGVLQQYLKPTHRAIGSINSPMQCMMKEICAQCLQPHVDPQTGKTTYVFSCFNQDQPLDQVDFGALAQRLAQNGVQEKLTALWIGRCLSSCRRPLSARRLELVS